MPRVVRAGSSAVEHWFYTPVVAGSKPVPPTQYDVRRPGSEKVDLPPPECWYSGSVRGRKKLSANAERRAHTRAEEKLGRTRERLARLAPGGEANHPLDVTSASVIEPQARSMPCPKCLGPCSLIEHAAETREGHRLRIAHTICRACGSRRAIYFRIAGDLLN